MSDLESKLMPEDKHWLSGTYKTTEEAFVVAEYFAKYVRKRWPKGSDDNSIGDRGHLYLELIDVDFKPQQEVPRKLVRLGFASDTLQIILPDRGYTNEEKETLRDFYQQKYAPIIKESHARTNALLWQTFSPEEREEILLMFNNNSELEAEIKKAIRQDIEKSMQDHDSKALKIQTRKNPSKGDGDGT